MGLSISSNGSTSNLRDKIVYQQSNDCPTPFNARASMRDKFDRLNKSNDIDISMPDPDELERRFNEGEVLFVYHLTKFLFNFIFYSILVLASMDLPPDKAKLLRGYDDERKWEMIRDQEKVSAKESPEFYLRKLQTYLDPKASRSIKKLRSLGGSTSTQVLRDLEISLRTNNIEWVREFLSESNNGLDILIEYLTFRLVTQQQQQQQLLQQQQNQQNSQQQQQQNGNHQNGSDHNINSDVHNSNPNLGLLRYEF